jgi:hypothetical protein
VAGAAVPGGAVPGAASPGNGSDVPSLAQDGLRWPEAALASLDLQRGAIGRLDAQEVTVTQGAIGAARADSITVDRGALGAAMANEIQARQSGISMLLAGQARIGQAVVRTIVAREVVVERTSLVGFLLARRVSGDVRVLFDWRGALAFGAVFGLLSRIGRGRR